MIKKKPSLSDNRVLVGAFYIALYSMLSFFRFNLHNNDVSQLPE